MSFITDYKRRNILFYPMFLCAVFFPGSCATTAVQDDRPFIWITDNSKFFLLSPKDIEKPLDEYQFMSASFAGQNYNMISWVKADETGMDIVLLNEMGANMGELIWRNGDISFTSAVFPSSMPPEYIIADFQLCFYNPAALTQALKKSGLSLVQTKTTRYIYMKKTLIIEITKGLNSIAFNNHLRGYAYTLEGELQAGMQ